MNTRDVSLLALLGVLGLGLVRLPGGAEAAQQDGGPPRPIALADELSRAFEDVAEEVRDSVVRIESVRRIDPSTVSPQGNPFEGTPFGDLFRQMPRQPRIQQGLGSGFVLTADGYIVTNYHVVQDATEVDVHFAGGDTRRAEIAGTDPQTDIALLKVEAEGLRPVRLGDSDQLRPGEWVIAAGTPFGLSSTITAGIVSAVGRANVGLADYEDFIQTDAAINPGNSGGPLLNLHGEVVGVSSAIYSRSGGYMGIGFAIPIEMFQAIRDDLIRHGTVTRGLLGVAIQDLDAGLARSFGFEGTDGVLVSEVREGSPAARAGLETGDIVVSFAGEPMTDKEELRFRVAETRPGTRVPVEVFRDGDVERVEVVIGELSAADASLGGPEQSESDLGMEVRSLSPDLAVRFGLPSDTSGVVVARVEPAGTAARAGLRSGDVITSIDGRDVASVADFRAALRAADVSDGVRLRVRSAQGRRFVFLQPRR